jgi:hypothetical protein
MSPEEWRRTFDEASRTATAKENEREARRTQAMGMTPAARDRSAEEVAREELLGIRESRENERRRQQQGVPQAPRPLSPQERRAQELWAHSREASKSKKIRDAIAAAVRPEPPLPPRKTVWERLRKPEL